MFILRIFIVYCILAAGFLSHALPLAAGSDAVENPAIVAPGENMSGGEAASEVVPGSAVSSSNAEAAPEPVPEPTDSPSGSPEAVPPPEKPLKNGDPLARKLFEIELASRVAEEELSKLPSLVQTERARVASELNQWANTELRRIIEKHHAQVEKALAETTLPEDHSSFGIWWKQLKAGVFLNEDIEEVVSLFVRRAGPRLSSVHEDFQRELVESLELRSRMLLRESMEEIRRPFIATVKDRLPLYNAIPVPNTEQAALALALGEGKDGMGRLSSGMAVVGGVVLMLLGRRLVERMMHLAVVKIGGKVLSRMVPVLGLGLLLYEGVQMGQAKEAFEEELRKSFLAEYVAEVTVDSVWNVSPDGVLPSMKQEVERNVDTLLSDWEKICRSEAVSMIHSARVLASSQHVRDYVSRELDRGADFQLILQRMNALWDAFGQSLAQEPVEFFESILIDSPDRNDLRLLSRTQDSRFIELYKAWGADFLKAVNKIGVENYVSTEWKSSDLNWNVLNRSLDFLPDISGNRNAARGLLFLIKEGVPVEGFSPDLMAKIAVKEDVFLKVWRAIAPDARKLAVLFESGRPLDVLEIALNAFPEATALFLRGYGVEFWTSWSNDDIFDLLRISEIRGRSGGRAGAAQVRPEERAELLEIFRRAGERGIILWDVHSKEPTGGIGRTLAKQSIDSLADGYPFEDMKDPELVRFAVACRKFPAGRFFYDTLKGVGSLVRYLLLGGVLLLFAGIFYGLFRRLWRAVSSTPSRYDDQGGRVERRALKDVFADDDAGRSGIREQEAIPAESRLIEEPSGDSESGGTAGDVSPEAESAGTTEGELPEETEKRAGAVSERRENEENESESKGTAVSGKPPEGEKKAVPKNSKRRRGGRRKNKQRSRGEEDAE